MTRTHWLAPSMADCVFIMCILGAVAVSGRMLSADGDPWRHLAVGAHILEAGAIPRTDVFSHTMAGAPFVPYEWLAEVTSALAYRAAGLAGPLLLHGAAVAASWALIFRQAAQRSGMLLLPLAVTALGITASAVHWLARPHVFTFLGLALFTTALDGWRAGRGSAARLWLLPPVMALWANLHGGFLVGFLVLAAYVAADAACWAARPDEESAAAGRRLRVLLPLALVTCLAPLVNPAGADLYVHVSGYFGQRFLVDNTQEYMSPDFHERSLWLFAALLFALVAAMAWSRRRPALHEVLLALGFAFCALYSARNVPLFALVAVPLLVAQLAAGLVVRPEGAVGRVLAPCGGWLARRDERYGRVDRASRGHLWPLSMMAGLVALAVMQQAQGRPPLGAAADPRRQPVAAVSFLKAAPPEGNVFNEFIWGGYLLHELWPERAVFIDGQTDFYGEALTREYVRVIALAPGWEQILERHDVQWVISPTNSSLVARLRELPEWRVSYEDNTASVLVLRGVGGR